MVAFEAVGVNECDEFEVVAVVVVVTDILIFSFFCAQGATPVTVIEKCGFCFEMLLLLLSIRAVYHGRFFIVVDIGALGGRGMGKGDEAGELEIGVE